MSFSPLSRQSLFTAAMACLQMAPSAAGNGPAPYWTTRNFPLTQPGNPILVGKGFDPKTGEEIFISQSPRVKTAADLVALEKAEQAAEVSKHGALNGFLRKRFYEMQDEEEAEVVVYLRYPSLPAALDPETHGRAQLEAREREIQAVKPVGDIHAILEGLGNGLRNVAIRDEGSFACRADKRQLDLLRRHPMVGQIELRPATAQTATYLFSTLATSSYNPASGVPTIYRGQGVNAATLESGLSNTRYGSDGKFYPLGNIVSCLNLNTGHVLPSPSTPPWKEWTHSHQTFKCLWQTAPYANLFHKTTRTSLGNPSGDFISQENVDFILNNRIQTASISLSMGDSYDSKSCDYNRYGYAHPGTILPWGATAIEMEQTDEWAYRYPYPVLCNPAANWGTDFMANWQCYNGLSVGNVRHTGLTHYEIPADATLDLCQPRASCTQTRNPVQLWGGSGLRPPLSADGLTVYSEYSGDREMPYVVVPGMTPDAAGATMVDQNPSCVDGPLFCGTSFSAPTLNGIVACVISSDSRMVSRPHVVWATLMATAENVTDGYWSSQFDGKDGTGVVSGASAIAFARNHSEPGPNAAAVVNGIASATLSNTTANGSTAKYNILIPNPKPAGKHLRVVLTWTSNPVRYENNYLSDLDLSVGSQNGTYTSASYNANVEIVDIPAAQLASGSSYPATISLWANRIPPGGISGGLLKYALAWTWVKDHAD